MRLKIYTCPECKFRKFESFFAMNVHLGKMHTVPYKIVMRNNKPYRIMKKRAKVVYLNEIKTNIAKAT